MNTINCKFLLPIPVPGGSVQQNFISGGVKLHWCVCKDSKRVKCPGSSWVGCDWRTRASSILWGTMNTRIAIFHWVNTPWHPHTICKRELFQSQTGPVQNRYITLDKASQDTRFGAIIAWRCKNTLNTYRMSQALGGRQVFSWVSIAINIFHQWNK
jgi:hypothetical protein